ncbi:MAG: hypothetical protein HY052_06955 [Proteobacteria bacterium]|nr:hypothetical protein [Pseudomonadota bacterium]
MTKKCKSCGSCGMSLEKQEDFALGDTAADYCHYCTDSAGKLFPFEKILKMNIAYYMESQGITETAASKMALEYLRSLPAWRSHA